MCSDHRNLQSACHRISFEWDTKPTAEERLGQTACLSLCFVSLRVCVVSFICVCIWRFFFYFLFYLFVCADGLIWRLVVTGLPFRVKRLPRSLVSAAFCFSPSGEQPGLRWRLELLLAWLTKYVPVGTAKASNTGALRGREARQKTTNLLNGPWGERQVSVTEMSLRKQNTQRL